MTIIFDENLSQELVYGLRGFGEDVHHVIDEFGRGVADEDWLREVGKKDWKVITRDRAIRRRPAEIEAIRRNRVGAFFLGGKRLSRWELITQVIRGWQEIQEKAETIEPPFIYIVSRAGRKIDRLE